MTKPLPDFVDTAADVRASALDWFVRRHGGEPAQGGAAAEFEAWLRADPAHGQAYARLERSSAQIDDIPPELRAALRRDLAYDKAMEAASARGAERLAAPAAAAPGQPARRKALALGAYAVVALATGSLLWRHRQAQPLLAQSFETGRGEQSEVPLPDGSTLRLDTATRLEVTYYRDRRELKLLEGQVFLKVHKDADSPFQVRAGAVSVTVVGTQFSVRHTPRQAGADGVEVAVSEGKVKVEGVTAIYLTAGQQVAGDRAGVLGGIATVSPEQATAWQHYQVRFLNRRLDQVLAELSRYRDWPLVIDDPEVAALQVSGVFDPRDVQTFQRVLPLSQPVRLVDLADGRKEVVLRR